MTGTAGGNGICLHTLDGFCVRELDVCGEHACVEECLGTIARIKQTRIETGFANTSLSGWNFMTFVVVVAALVEVVLLLLLTITTSTLLLLV